MAYRDARNSIRSLHAIAVTQGGYFTAKQAADVGYDYPHLSYHLKAGNFERAGHGLYRVVTIPQAEQDQLIRLSLWSRDRRDEPQAVVSHDSALALHDLSDVLPCRIHLTVPMSFRKAAPAACVIHRSELVPGEIEQRDGYRSTTPLRTLIDVAGESKVTDEQLARAVADALREGLVRESKLAAAAHQFPAAARLLHHLSRKG